MAITKNNF